MRSTLARNGPAADCAWVGEMGWRGAAEVRESLFDELEGHPDALLRLDVRAVSSIDRVGIAMLIGANWRARALGRRLVLIDSFGPVTAGLSRLHALEDFEMVQVPPDPRTPRSG